MEEDGQDYNFLGVILANLNVAMDQKERCSQIIVDLATQLGADFFPYLKGWNTRAASREARTITVRKIGR